GIPGCGQTKFQLFQGPGRDGAAQPHGPIAVATTAEHQPALPGKVGAGAQLRTVGFNQHGVDGHLELKTEKEDHGNPPWALWGRPGHLTVVTRGSGWVPE